MGAMLKFSKERILFKSQDLPIVSSWNLSSQKIEWMQLTDEYPQCANARYLVTGDSYAFSSNIVIRDYSQ